MNPVLNQVASLTATRLLLQIEQAQSGGEIAQLGFDLRRAALSARDRRELESALSERGRQLRVSEVGQQTARWS